MPPELVKQLIDDAVLDSAFNWMCDRRREYSGNSDVWSFRRGWPVQKQSIKQELAAGDFRFGLLRRITKADGSECDLWSARDAVVLKALTVVLAAVLPVSPLCTHVKGHGGAKAAVRQVRTQLATNRFVLRTDVRSYYASIDHVLLIDRISRFVPDRIVLNLIGRYLRRTAERGGWFWDYERGILLACPLSPLIGAFFLTELDQRMARTGLFYVRFMDDILVLAPTRWKLRRSVATVNQIFAALRLEKHPDKTFIGKIARGFDFLGYHFSPQGLAIAEATLASFVDRTARLLEQERGRRSDPSPLGGYVRRWLAWARGGLRPVNEDRRHPGRSSWRKDWDRQLEPRSRGQGGLDWREAAQRTKRHNEQYPPIGSAVLLS
jgi:RNA-directed DNA polymerase